MVAMMYVYFCMPIQLPEYFCVILHTLVLLSADSLLLLLFLVLLLLLFRSCCWPRCFDPPLTLSRRSCAVRFCVLLLCVTPCVHLLLLRTRCSSFIQCKHPEIVSHSDPANGSPPSPVPAPAQALVAFSAPPTPCVCLLPCRPAATL